MRSIIILTTLAALSTGCKQQPEAGACSALEQVNASLKTALVNTQDRAAYLQGQVAEFSDRLKHEAKPVETLSDCRDHVLRGIKLFNELAEISAVLTDVGAPNRTALVKRLLTTLDRGQTYFADTHNACGFKAEP